MRYSPALPAWRSRGGGRILLPGGALAGPKRQPDGSLSLRERARVRGSTAGGCLCYRWLQRSLRSRLIVCVMSFMAQGAHRGRPVAAAPCTPGLRPAKSPLRGTFDFSLQASGRAEAASLQNTALSPHPCGLPRPSGNVSAILRPPAPAVSARLVNKLTAGRTNRRSGKRSATRQNNRASADFTSFGVLR